MSHYSVAILTKNKPTENTIKKIMAQYDEDLEVKSIIPREKIIKQVKDEIENYKNTTYAKYLADKESYKKDCANKEHLKYLEKIFPNKLKWTDEQCYESALAGYDEEDILPSGDVISHYNPNAKWDWYEIGGRWDGILKTVDTITHEIKEVNVCKIKDLVFDNTETKKAKLARFWELKIEEQQPINKDEEEYLKSDFYNKSYYIENYKDKEHYVLLNASFKTYAFVDEFGKWHEPGKMGWFGCANTDFEENIKYHEDFVKNVIENPNQNLYITIVDCHI